MRFSPIVGSGYAAIRARWTALGEQTMSIRTSLFCASVVILVGGGECQTQMCPPDRPVFNEMTGKCEPEGGDDTVVPGGRSFPPGPGTGGLRTEPDTETSMADDTDQDAVDLQVFGLNGRWKATDNGRISCILHTGSGVTSTLIEDRRCDHMNMDGSDVFSTTSADFQGTVVGNMITGTQLACRFGNSDPSLNGLFDFPMMLTISADGKTLSGTWNFDGDLREFSLERQTVGNCRTDEQQENDAFSRVRVPEAPSTDPRRGGGAR